MRQICIIVFLLFLASCSCINSIMDKDLKKHNAIVNMIINNPDSIYTYLERIKYVNREDYIYYISRKSWLVDYIKDNFKYGYSIKVDKVEKNGYIVNDKVIYYKTHDIVVVSRYTKKVLWFSFWNYHNNCWTLQSIENFYGARPIDPPQY